MKALGRVALGLSLTAAAVISLLALAGEDHATNSHHVDAHDYLSPDSRTVDALAVTAGNVMERGLGPSPARDAAWHVAGMLTDRSIETLQADGTTYDGTVVLRITTGLGAPDFSPPPLIKCYRYVFLHSAGSTSLQPLQRCPQRPALVLASPAPPVEVTATTRSRLARALTALTRTEVSDAASIQKTLAPSFPAPLVLVADGPGTGVNAGISVRITNTKPEYANSCVIAYLAPGHPWDVTPVVHGQDCRGG